MTATHRATVSGLALSVAAHLACAPEPRVVAPAPAAEGPTDAPAATSSKTDDAPLPSEDADKGESTPSESAPSQEADAGVVLVRSEECEKAALDLVWAIAPDFYSVSVAALEAGPIAGGERKVTFVTDKGRSLGTVASASRGELAESFVEQTPEYVFWVGWAGSRDASQEGLTGVGYVRVDPRLGSVGVSCAGRFDCSSFEGEGPWLTLEPPERARAELMKSCGEEPASSQ